MVYFVIPFPFHTPNATIIKYLTLAFTIDIFIVAAFQMFQFLQVYLPSLCKLNQMMIGNDLFMFFKAAFVHSLQTQQRLVMSRGIVMQKQHQFPEWAIEKHVCIKCSETVNTETGLPTRCSALISIFLLFKSTFQFCIVAYEGRSSFRLLFSVLNISL